MSNEFKDWIEEQEYLSPCEAIIEDLAYELKYRYKNNFEVLKKDTIVALEVLEEQFGWHKKFFGI